jgi:hypothetical protein
MNAPHGSFGPPPYAANPYVANPYAAPAPGAYAPVDARAAPGLPLATRREAALYPPSHVALATFLGSPFGGAVLMAINEHRVGRTGVAVKTLLAGFFGTGVLFALASMLPDGIPRFPISLGPLWLMAAIAKGRQDAFVRQHIAMGGKRASAWAAAGIGLLSALVVLVPFVVVLVLAQAFGAASP